MRKHKWIIISVIILILFLLFYVTASRITPSTSDAYVEAHVVQIAPRVSGRVIEVTVSNNASVKKGQLLFKLNPNTYQHELNRALASLDEAKNQVKSIEAQVVTQEEIVSKAKANFDYIKVCNFMFKS